MDPSSFVEKSDMISRVRELAAQGPAVTGDGSVQLGPYTAPPGYAFDAASGYFLNSEVSVCVCVCV